MNTAFAIVAHPDDIEFHMAGTLLLLRQAGWETHCMTIASGSLGSVEYSAAETRRIRREEARQAAAILGAHGHPSLVDDLEIFYDPKLVKQVCAVVREVQPKIVLTQPPDDYMEDHTNAGRLAVTAAFARGMPNFITMPRRPAYGDDVTVYHCLPHGLRDPLRRPVIPEIFVNISSVIGIKGKALAAHQSQANWLETSQGMNAFVLQMEEESRALGKMSRKFRHAEGWWRHSHLGFSVAEVDPLRDALGRNYLLNPAYGKALKGCL